MIIMAENSTTATATAAAHVPFTNVTWESINYELRAGQLNGMGWEVQVDLGYELAARTHLTVEQARRMVSAVNDGALPVMITVRRDSVRTGYTERFAATISDLWTYERSARVYYRSWGFSGPIWLSDIVDVEIPR